jgi:hypothetical protein
MESRSYGPVSRPDAEQFLVMAQNAGLTVTKTSDVTGSVTGLGTHVDYSYDENSQRITLNLVRRPPFLKLTWIWRQIEQRLPASVSRVA